MNLKKMFFSLIPWVVFSVVINRRGADAAAVAALAAAGLSLFLLVKDRARSGVKIIDVTGVVTFGALAVVGFSDRTSVLNWIADYGRGTAAIVLAVIMLASAITVPFTESYARQVVAPEHWKSRAFRSVNRKISGLWGLLVAVMGCGHLLAGAIDPASNPGLGSRPVDLILNWGVPVAVILFGVRQTQRISEAARSTSVPEPRSATDRPKAYADKR